MGLMDWFDNGMQTQPWMLTDGAQGGGQAQQGLFGGQGMQGLLGGLGGRGDRNDALRQALITAGLGLMAGRGRNLGESIGQAGLMGMQAYGGAKQQQRHDAMQDLQMQQLLGEVKKRQQQAAALKNMPSPDMMASQRALAAGGGPTNENAAAVRAPDPRTTAAYGMAQAGLIAPEHYIEKFADPNYGRPEVARTVDGADATGMPQTLQFDKFGGAVGAPVRKPVENKLMNLGGSEVAYNPFGLKPGQQFQRTNTPDALLSAGTARRGQDMTDARSRETNALTREAQQTHVFNDPFFGPLLLNKGSGVARRATMDGQPVPGEKALAERKNSSEVLKLLDQADGLIGSATGSYGGAAIDQAARAVGKAPDGAVAIGQLKALEGALIAKMPRLEGPQSDADRKLYQQAVGQIGDPTVPQSIKKAALATVREIQTRYAGGGMGAAGGVGSSTQQQPTAPRPGTVQDGYLFKGGNPADPSSWVRQ